MTLVSLNDVDNSCTLQLFFVHVATIKIRQMRDETNECLSVSVKKTNKDAQMLKHSCYIEGAITRVANQGC